MDKLISMYLENAKASGRATNTLLGYKSILTQFSERLESELRFASQDDVLKFISESGKKPNTLNRRHSCLSKFYSYLEAHCEILFNPISKIQAPKVPSRLPSKVMTTKETIKVLKEFDCKHEDKFKFRNKVIVELMYSCSLRRSEAVNLDLQDLDLPSGTIRIKAGKTKIGRVVPIGELASQLLTEYIELHHSGTLTEPLFLSLRNKRLAPDTVTRMATQARKSANIRTRASSHSFRKTSATQMLRNGAPLVTVSRILGHRQLSSTTVYTKVYPKDIIKMHKAKHPRERQKNVCLPALKVPKFLYGETPFKLVPSKK